MTLYEIILGIHITTAVLLIGGVVYADHLALAWILGKKKNLSESVLRQIHRSLYIGITVMVLTGIYLFIPSRAYLLYETAFFIKMFFVATLIINSLCIGKFLPLATKTAFQDLSTNKRFVLLLSGTVSTCCWLGTIVAANQLGL